MNIKHSTGLLTNAHTDHLVDIPSPESQFWNEQKLFSIQPDDSWLPLQGLWLPLPGRTESLLVSLHGAIDRARTNLPRFERVRSLEGVDAHRLYLADPTLALNENIRIGWYLGTREDDVTVRYGALIRCVANAVSAKQIIITGTSGGGFAAMALTPRVPRSLALAFSPQSNVGRFGEQWSDTLMKYAFDGLEYSALEGASPHRTDIAALYKTDPRGRVWYVQNSGDDSHVRDHEQPLKGAVDERITFVSEFHAAGHTPPTPERVRAWIEFALDNFWSDPREFALS